MTRISLLLLILLLPPALLADRVILKSGGILEGKILSADEDRVVFKTAFGQHTLPRDRVERLETAPLPEEEYRERARHLALAYSEKEERELARWCKEKNLSSQARMHWENLRDRLPEDPEVLSHFKKSAAPSPAPEPPPPEPKPGTLSVPLTEKNDFRLYSPLPPEARAALALRFEAECEAFREFFGVPPERRLFLFSDGKALVFCGTSPEERDHFVKQAAAAFPSLPGWLEQRQDRHLPVSLLELTEAERNGFPRVPDTILRPWLSHTAGCLLFQAVAPASPPDWLIEGFSLAWEERRLGTPPSGYDMERWSPLPGPEWRDPALWLSLARDQAILEEGPTVADLLTHQEKLTPPQVLKAWKLVAWLLAHDREKFFRWLALLANAPQTTPAASLLLAFQKTPAELEAGWRRYVLQSPPALK